MMMSFAAVVSLAAAGVVGLTLLVLGCALPMFKCVHIVFCSHSTPIAYLQCVVADVRDHILHSGSDTDDHRATVPGRNVWHVGVHRVRHLCHHGHRRVRLRLAYGARARRLGRSIIYIAYLYCTSECRAAFCSFFSWFLRLKLSFASI
jgi:hypothetical protein